MMKVKEDVEDPNQFILDVVQERIAALDHEDAKKKKKPPKTDTSIQQEYNMAKKVASGCAQQQHDEDDDTENSSQFILGVVEERLSYQVGAAVAVGEEQEQHAKKADKDGGKAKEVHAVVPVGVPVESNTATTAPCSFTKVNTDAAPTRLSRQRNVSRVSRPGAFSIAPRGAGRGGATAATTTTTSTLDDANGSAISSSVVHNNDQHNNDVEDGLAVARMVSALPEAELQQYVEEETTPATSQEDNRKRMALWLWPGLVLILFLGVILLLVMLLVVQAKEGDPTNGTLIPQAQPNRPTQSLNDHILSLLPDETVRAIQAEQWSSPQKKAYQWLVQDPYLNSVTYPDWRLVQRFALATFFYATDGENWKQNTDWLSYEIPECEWYKSDALSALVLKPPMDPVYYMNPEHVCGGPGFYHHLWLGYSGLRHSLPDEFFLLTHLRSIALGRNELTGTLSSRMGLFQDLEGFAIAHTNIEGSIPTELGLLSNLTALVLVDQPLRSTIPSELGLLSDILYIQIDHCPHLAGSIPTEIGRLTQAKHLVMNHAMLSGSLPSEIGLMTSLTALMLASNDLIGDIPEEIGNLVVNASLVHWTFAGNDFSEEKPTPFTPPGMPGWPGQFPPIASPPEIVINIQHGNQAHCKLVYRKIQHWLVPPILLLLYCKIVSNACVHLSSN